MIILFQQVGTLMFFALVGFLLGKFRLLNGTHAKALSVMCVYFFVPCSVFKTFSSNFTPQYLQKNFALLLDSVFILVLMALMAALVSHLLTKNRYEQKVFSYSLTIPNYGYMGYALAASFLGENALMDVMIFCLPLSLYVYTVGFSSLTNRKPSLKKLLNPVMIVTVAGMIFGLCQIPVPGMVTNIAAQGAGCMGPISMILLGLTLSEIRPKELFSDIHIFEISALRLLVIPIAIWFAAKAVFGAPIATIAAFVYAMPCGLNTVVYPKLVGENCKTGTSLAFVSNIMACGTIPLVMLLAGV